MSKDECMGFHVGPIYVEHCMSGDTNIGVEAGAYAGVGYKAGAGAYWGAKVSSHEGFSGGCGTIDSDGVEVESPVVGVYANVTYASDTRDN